MSLSVHLSSTMVDSGAFRCLMLSSVNISKPPQTNQPERPTKDYEVLSKLFDVGVVDTENYLDHAGMGVRLAEKAGQGWGLAAAAVARAHEYHAVLAMSDDVGVTMAVLMQFARRRIPVFIVTQHMMARRPAFFIGKLHMTGAITKFLCLVPQQVELLRDQYQVDPAKIELIDYHVDHRFYQPMPEVPVKHQICSAGMTFRDYATLLRATRGLGVPVKIEAQSAWFNDGVNFSPDEIHDQVEICNYGTSAGLRSLYAESEIVVVPLQNVPVVAGFSTLLEGMAMGKPVIASRINMIGSFIEDGVNGFLVTPERPDELREKLSYLLEHPEEARRMGERARQSVEQHFTLEHYTQRIYTTIAEALSRK
jgi:glycosyltransferase involved in cell wall biosynthesis